MPLFYAPAKINLSLHVTGQRDDGYHLLDSLTVFAKDVFDTLSVEPADEFSFTASGPFAAGLGMDERNLVVRAAREMAAISDRPLFLRLHLEKNIPMGAGLGGGSADAAATVKALEHVWNLQLATPQRDAFLLKLGADVPVCYHGKAARFEGIGEKISDIPPLPCCHALLVWPQAHSSTREVFAARKKDYSPAMIVPDAFETLPALIDFLKTTSNDLAEAAEHLSPVIMQARLIVSGLTECLFTRMSGSGSCIYGLFADAESCTAAKVEVRRKQPQWWAHTSAL